MFLALFYAFGLWLVGLKYGLIIGLLTGFFSFIPYIGMALGMCVGLAVAAFQFQDLVMIGWSPASSRSASSSRAT